MSLVTPDRFANGDPRNDTIEAVPDRHDRVFNGGLHGGDAQGIIDSLDSMESMGFAAIWVNPFFGNDMPTYSYHGYAATD